ncbi:uncharacterized protein LOC143294738 isoform X2 [Babylonia areolata]|uniref:uncharacterized protein LOC143294738 isoform X2 n=1 Tax=Babylonia areolata TaxID=304850 RepID=UPI003FD12D5A
MSRFVFSGDSGSSLWDPSKGSVNGVALNHGHDSGTVRRGDTLVTPDQLCDLHVYKVPLDLWRAPLNNMLNQSVTETVSLGIIRVPPDLHLFDIRVEIEKQLEELAPKDYVFLRSVGRSITRVKPRQEYEWTAKHFLPPKHYAPELYILEAPPELREALAISERSSQPLSPASVHQGGSPATRGYRDPYGRYTFRQGYPDEARSQQRRLPDKAAPPLRHYSPLPRIDPPGSPPRPRSRELGSSPDRGAFLTDTHPNGSRVHHPSSSDSRLHPGGDRYPRRGEEEEGGGREGDDEGSHPYYLNNDSQAPQTSPRKNEADRGRSRTQQPIGVFYHDGPSPHVPVDRSGSPRSPSPHRKGGGGGKTQREEREAAYTNNTNEDSGVAGMSPDTSQQYSKHRDPYYRTANSKSRGRYDDEEEEKRRVRELDDRDRWANDEHERRRREEEEREREEARRRKEEEEERRRREEEERRREEEEERRKREEEEEEERRRRQEEEEDRLKVSSDEELNRFSSPPPRRSSSADLDGPRDSESAQEQRKEEQRKLLEELQEARDSRHSTEREREELVKKAKTLQSKTQNRRNLARDVWKKRYFEEKKRTPPLEDQTNRLRDELDALHRKLMNVLEGPKEKNLKTGDNRPSQKNNYIIQCTRLQHNIDDLKRRVENAKMKLTAEMKLRTQAEAELRAVRAEAVQKKINMRGHPFQVY